MAATEQKPWHIEKRDDQWCVILDADSSVVKCHDTQTAAQAHLDALYANVPDAGKGQPQMNDEPKGLQYRAYPAEFKAAGDKGIYEGYFSIFGNQDDGGDVMLAGAFAKTIAERAQRIKVFFGHDWSKLIGPPPDVLEEDSKGLYAKGRLTLGSFWGNEAWQLMKDGALREGSIGYETLVADWDPRGVRFLKEVKLYEISPVPLGMNPLTEIQAVKMFRTADASTIELLLTSIKAGARHSATDAKLIQAMHDTALELGAMCPEKSAPKPETTPDAERAAPSALARAAQMRAASRALAQLQDSVRRSKR